MISTKTFDFNSINLVPRKCIVESRRECDTTTKIGKFTFKLPVVPANMQCVMDDTLAEKLAENGYFYIHHRFDVDVFAFSKYMKSKNLPVSISIGVNEDSYELITKLIGEKLYPDFITIDIAHGHAIKMKKMLQWLRAQFPTDHPPFLIAGNVSTAEAVIDLEEWGADAIKCGIGCGSACTTYTATGFGSRGIQASSVHECAKARKKALIIADGGIREPGDIAKSIALGADLVMVGGMFSGLQDSPGPTVRGTDGQLYKEFWGSASMYQSGKSERIEGTKKLIPLQQQTMLEMMNYITECLQSAVSYAGGKTLNTLKTTDWLLKEK
jgi:GMP reductase